MTLFGTDYEALLDEDLLSILRQVISHSVFIFCFLYIFRLEKHLKYQVCFSFFVIASIDELIGFIEVFAIDFVTVLTFVTIFPSFIILWKLCRLVKSMPNKMIKDKDV